MYVYGGRDPDCDHSDLELLAPECLASVCTTWREALSYVPDFWAHFVIWIGRNPTPLSRIREYLSWSADRPLHVYVLRRYDPLLQDDSEKARVAEIFQLLLPHMERWRLLYIRCLRSSSLPCPRVELCGSAPSLRRLSLTFFIDDLVYELDAAPPADASFDTPTLRTMSLSGVHFRRAYVDHLPEDHLSFHLKDLSLVGYDAQNPPFILADILRYISPCSFFGTLKLDALELAPSKLHPAEHINFFSGNLDFVSMNGDVIAELVALTGEDAVVCVTYTDCTPPSHPETGPRRLIAGAEKLAFYGFASADALMWFLMATGGHISCKELYFQDCDGLTAEVFRALANTRREPDSAWICYLMRKLTIVGCTRFCSADLREALEARLENHEGEGDVACVKRLSVTGCCKPDSRDWSWIDGYVRHAEWKD